MLTDLIRSKTLGAISALYDIQLSEKELQINITKPEFEGDYTVVLFSLVKSLKKSPDDIGNTIGQYLHFEMIFLQKC